MAMPYSPTAIKRWIAGELRGLREKRNVSREELADLLGRSVTHIGHLETGRNLPSPTEMDALLTYYELTDRAMFFRSLLRAAKSNKDWWREMSEAFPAWFNLYLGLESSAVKLRSYGGIVVPGLLQTVDYAEHLLRSVVPDIADNELKRQVQLRVRRQAVLHRDTDPLNLWTVLDEAVLRRRVGSTSVMDDQLGKLLELEAQPNITIQVVPLVAGGHPAAHGTFTMLEFPPELPSDPGMVYVETAVGGIYYDKPAELSLYRETLARLQVLALNPEDSTGLITTIREELNAA